MSKTIQIRDVPDELQRELESRAAEAGVSLSAYIKRELVRSADRPVIEEIDARIRARGPSPIPLTITLETLGEARDR